GALPRRHPGHHGIGSRGRSIGRLGNRSIRARLAPVWHQALRRQNMATQTAPLTREQLVALPESYFKAVDAMNVDAILSHFADNAVLIVQTDHAVFDGADEIRRMFTDFVDNSVSIFHEIKNIV